MRKINLILHTHWDREWYFTKDETQVLLINHLKEVIEYLEQNDDVIYILDGQSVMIDDFLAFAPKWETRLRHVIEKQQLRVGPWYTQTDLLIVHGESIIRNLYYGIKRAEEFGEPMRVGYAPDTFGHNAQMPQIYSQFDIHSTFFWRGFSELKTEKSDFTWQGVDGTTIVGVNLATGYQGAKYLESDKVELQDRLKKIMDVLDKYSQSESRLIMNGHDQMPLQLNIKEIKQTIEEIYPDDTVAIGDFETYVNDLKTEQLAVVSGELNDSKHARIHRTINSTRMDIKLLNTSIEYRIINVLEPLAAKATEFGFEYPHELIEHCWKELFGVHAHDSIGGCNSDKVNQDINQRLLQVQETVETQIELMLRQLALINKRETGHDIILFNPLPYTRTNQRVQLQLLTEGQHFSIQDQKGKEIPYTILSQEYIEAGTIDRQVAARLLDDKVYATEVECIVDACEGFSLTTLSCVELPDFSEKLEESECDQQVIENEYYTISLDPEENIAQLFHKQSKQMISPLFYIENSGDAGDSYDYSPPVNDFVISTGKMDQIQVKKTEDFQVLTYQLDMQLPKNQAERELQLQTKNQVFTIQVRLVKNSQHIDINIDTVNKIADSRFRLAINHQVKTETIEADMQLSTVQRNIVNTLPLSVWEKEKWAEKPVSVETFQSYVARYNEKLTSAIFAFGHKEYEAFETFTYITLFRSFSHLGKRNLVNRPGRPSGIEIPTPDNQLQNTKFSMQFALVYTTEESGNNFAKQAKEWLTPCVSYQVKKYNRFNINVPQKNLVSKQQIIELQIGSCVVSCLKKTELDDALFIRLFNPKNKEITIDFSKISQHVYAATIDEKKVQKTKTITVAPQQIINLILDNE